VGNFRLLQIEPILIGRTSKRHKSVKVLGDDQQIVATMKY